MVVDVTFADGGRRSPDSVPTPQLLLLKEAKGGKGVRDQEGRAAMEIGIVDYVLRGRETACFFAAQELGFDFLELSAESIGDPGRLLFDPTRRGELDDLRRATGVPVKALYATHFIHESLVADEKTRWPALLALRDLAERAQEHKIPLVVVPFFGASGMRTPSELAAFEAVLSQMASWDDLSSVHFALKTFLEPDQIASFVDRVGSNRMGICFDPANTTAVHRDMTEDLEALGRRVLHVHLKDRAIERPDGPANDPCVDLKALLRALSRIGYQGGLSIEVPSDRTGIDAARRTLTACRRNLAA